MPRPEAVVGAGTLRTPADVKAAVAAGARFGVSPGLSAAVLDAAEAAGLPMLPGVATPTEAMAGAERGLEILKFFPAEANGGAPVLRAWAEPAGRPRLLPDRRHRPRQRAAPISASATSLCVGGSWVAPTSMVASGDWQGITRLAAEAAALRTQAG